MFIQSCVTHAFVHLLWQHTEKKEIFMKYLALDVSANCIREIHCLALDGFKLKTVHKLRSKEKKSRWSQDLNLVLLGAL